MKVSAYTGIAQVESGQFLYVADSGHDMSYKIDVYDLSGQFTAGLTKNTQTGLFYPAANPSGFTMNSQTGIFVTTSQTGLFYPAQGNPSGFVLTGQTGVFYSNSNPSGYVTTGQTGVFYPISNPSGFVTGNVVRPTETGNFFVWGLTVASGNYTGISYNRIIEQNLANSTVILPPSLGVLAIPNIFVVKNASAGDITVIPSGSQFLDGVTGAITLGTKESVTTYSTTNGWNII